MRKIWLILIFMISAGATFMTPIAQGSLGPKFSKKRVELSNGLVVIAVEKHKLPMVHIEMLVKAGAIYDSEEKAGIANLVSKLLDKGTKTRTALEIAEEIDFMGARSSISSSSWTTRGYITVLKKDLDKGFDLVSDIVMNPAFKEEEIERERKKALSAILRKKENPNSVASETFREIVYEGHPLHRPSDGYQETVEKITQKDILDFYQAFYKPNNSILVIVGDLKLDEILNYAKKYFGTWQKGTVNLPDISDVKPHQGKKVKLVNMDINQSYLQCGHIGIRRNDPDYSACRAMNYILGGGGFASRFFKEIRKEAGLAYSVYSYFMGGSLQPGTYTAGLQTKVESTSDALNRMLEMIERIRTELVTEDELSGAKTYYEGSLARQGETYRQVAGLILNGEYFGLPDQYWVKEIEEIQTLSRERIREVARKYLDPDNFAFAIATKKSDLDLNVKGIEPGMIE
jgi:zinc protease